MTDEFDHLRDALRKAPAPQPEAKAAAMRAAMENFDRAHQGTRAAPRPIQDRQPKAGFLKGVSTMFSKLGSRPFLAATTSAAAICLGLIVFVPYGAQKPVAPPLPATPEQTVKGRASVPAKPAQLAEESAPKPPAPSFAPELAQTAPSSVPVEVQPAPPPAAHEQTADAVMPPVANLGVIAESDEVAGAPLPAPSYAPTGAPELARRKVSTTNSTAPMNDIASVIGTVERAEVAPDTEAFPHAEANPIKVATEEPVSTFSIDVDTASYAVVRSSLMRGQMPPVDAVRVEEMINYFPYDYPGPAAGEAPFKTTVTVMGTPWKAGTRLVRIGVQGRLPAVADRPPLNLVFLIDTSGSMNEDNKLPLLKQSLRLLLPQLRPEDEVAIVTYAGSAGEVLPPTRAKNAALILDALDRLQAGGSTAGAEGLELAYRVAEKMTAKGEVSRVLLATDGDFNVGISDPEGLEKYVEKKRKSGTYLSVLGFGRGNLDDATMQALAQSGNGIASYIDTLQEARKVLVDQLSGALFPIADDVKIQVEWNPAEVAEYRLIGYETRALAREDFNNDKVDAGEIGAGTSVTALYEITAPGSPAIANDALRYKEPPTGAENGELGFLRLRYKAPGETKSHLVETAIPAPSEAVDMPAPSADDRFAASIAGFGQLLTGGKYLGDWGWDDAIALALEGRGPDEFGYRAEAINLMRLAKSLSGQ
ncbi:VWA domain-containing protein [Pseudorhodobacter sp.]|uniref:VWA domain-containing protein n=1 Tax=Pseudorhodobacter sp. TaxID=1934400 RepID=UPI002647F9EE|nr:VWA domain-containing protein [Pseudorhodobacter sp.]MDN5785957.1 von Willebrand factor type A domain-containing protein [Pseudorhodobacter sp.]